MSNPFAGATIIPPEDEEEEVVQQKNPFAGASVSQPIFTSDEYLPDLGMMQETFGVGFLPPKTQSAIFQNLYDSLEYQKLGDGSGFVTKAQRNMIQDAIDAHNQALYESKGTEMGFGKSFMVEPIGTLMGGRAREQRVEDKEGNKRTYIVQRPDVRDIDRVTGKTIGDVYRTVTAGVGEAARAVGSGVEFLADKVTDPLGITEPKSYIAENYPTNPPVGTLDDIGQEVVSTMIGAVSGGGLANKFQKAYNLSPKMGKYLAEKWGKIRKKDPEFLADEAKLFIKTFITGTGANIGATALTPEDAEPLLGDDVISVLGLDPEDNRTLSIFADNVAFSTGIFTLGLAAEGLKKGLISKFFKGSKGLTQKTMEKDLGMLVLSELDPNIIGTAPEIIAERATIMGDVLRSNSTFKAEFLANAEIGLDTSTALRMGADEYVNRAYAWQKSFMDPDEFKKFSDELAESMVTKMIDLRRVRLSKGMEVRNQDARMVEGFQGAMTKTALESGGKPSVDAAGSALVEPRIGAIKAADERLQDALNNLEAKTKTLSDAQNKNAVMDDLKQAKQNDILAGNTEYNNILQTLSGDQLYDAWKKSYDTQRAAWDNLPPVELDVARFAQLVQDVAGKTDNFDAVTLVGQTKSDPLRTIIDVLKGNPNDESMDAVIERLQANNFTLTKVVQDIRPMIVQRIDYLKSQKQDFKALVEFKKGIDQMVDEVYETTNDASFKNAKELWQKHQDTFHKTDELDAYSARAAEVVPGVKNQNKANVAGFQQLQNALNTNHPEAIEPFINALQQATPESVSADLATAFVGLAMNALQRGVETGVSVGSSQIRNAVQPYVQYLDNLPSIGPEVTERYRTVVRDLEMLELGLVDAKEVADKAQKAYEETLKQAKQSAAHNFIYEIGNTNMAPSANMQADFEKVFMQAQSPNIIADLMREADDAGPLVKQGLQTAYLEYLAKITRVSKGIGLAEGATATTVRDMSPAAVAKILEDPASPVLNNIATIFSDQPERAQQIVYLLEMMDVASGSRSITGQTFSSLTNYDADLKKLMDRLITIKYGVLNPQATIMRNLGDALSKGKRKSIQEAANSIMNDMAANPEALADIMDLVARGQDESAIKKMTKLAARPTYYGYGEEQEQMYGAFETPQPQ